MGKIAVVLVNVGTPDSPSVKDVRKYLSQFLNDRRVIDLPWLLQKVLVNLIIVPFRAPKSAKLYQQLWSDKGSPLLYHSQSVATKLQVRIGDQYLIFNAMRYGNPSLNHVLQQIKIQSYNKIILLPLFPQYASATTGTVSELVLSEISRWQVIPELKIINHFHDHPAFIEAFTTQAEKYNSTKWDHVLFSFHGLPLRQIDKIHPKRNCRECRCKTETVEEGKLCYMAACYETARRIAKRMGYPENHYSVSFQSRLTKNWMSPFTDKMLIQKAQEGIKNLLIFAPSFVSDCLETTIELGKEGQTLFQKYGGEKLQLVEGLNDQDHWIERLVEIIQGAE